MSAPITDNFMTMLHHSSEVTTGDFVGSQIEMQKLLKIFSGTFSKFLANRMLPHPHLQDINETCWPINYRKKRVTFRTKSKIISSGELLQ